MEEWPGQPAIPPSLLLPQHHTSSLLEGLCGGNVRLACFSSSPPSSPASTSSPPHSSSFLLSFPHSPHPEAGQALQPQQGMGPVG